MKYPLLDSGPLLGVHVRIAQNPLMPELCRHWHQAQGALARFVVHYITEMLITCVHGRLNLMGKGEEHTERMYMIIRHRLHLCRRGHPGYLCR